MTDVTRRLRAILETNRPAWLVSADLGEITPNTAAGCLLETLGGAVPSRRSADSPTGPDGGHPPVLLQALRRMESHNGSTDPNGLAHAVPRRITCSLHGAELELLVLAVQRGASDGHTHSPDATSPCAYLLLA